ncbi:malonate decarboxylase holo-ACP synthase [Paraburkholderia caffeinilytica]|uniref:Phosphoribosyl-dephospho-CoA transferase n=1 Tax=Paraburkholderia caffeinilytica TaxID=1761016 RepID=A0ABQ1NDG7_9BURK|nr:malonate decarboxylase holo-ACP synthase [Paraburkholderia caffeinilytica]AXL49835.1 malonate decarboxylase holo-ACP synthase [Paraburkholderia caffeinilytica]GGC61691.1 phosphoribosyl-dephospho-CoA transferase [Paraburkholderia caffeinilytica]CAB3795648.1 Phosphoribosyl-dephospho-CoA transferase [Paraburkholderia caffeinilytica]
MQVCAAPPFAANHALSCDARWRPHDLLRLTRLPQLDGEPAWVRGSFARAPYAVVRRALAANGFVAIGLRGAERSQRYGTWVHRDDIEIAVPPEALARSSPLAERNALPAFATLAALQRDTAGALTGFVWGPTGSTGFELATQIPTATFSSDLDLLIRAPEKLSRHAAIQLLDYLQATAQRTGSRVDAQLETPAGGVALAEWAADKARVMARHARGPLLVADPWAPARDST